MTTIPELERRLEEAENLLSVDQAQDRMDELEGMTLQRHAEELRTQLTEAKSERAIEVLELRLSGEEFARGSVALDFLSKIGSHLSAAVYRASKYIGTGKPGGRIPSFIRETIDLRLAGLARGSTRIFVTGNTAPDLFGRSLLEESLRSTFEMLDSESPDELMDHASGLGASSVREMKSFLETLSKEDATITMRWVTPNEIPLSWDGDKEKVRQVAQTLSRLESLQPEEISTEGEIVMLSLRGKMEIQPDDGRAIMSTVPESLLGTIKELHVGQRVKTLIRKDTLYNKVTGTKKEAHTVLRISSA